MRQSLMATSVYGSYRQNSAATWWISVNNSNQQLTAKLMHKPIGQMRPNYSAVGGGGAEMGAQCRPKVRLKPRRMVSWVHAKNER